MAQLPGSKGPGQSGSRHLRGSVSRRMSTGANALEPTDSKQSGSRPSRYLREHRLRLTIWIGAVEGVLTLIGLLPHLAVYILAALAIVFWAVAGRKYSSPTARNLSWIFAASQAIAVLI